MLTIEGETLSVFSTALEGCCLYSVYSIAVEGDLCILCILLLRGDGVCILCILLQGRGRVFRKPGAVVLLPASGRFPTQPIFLLLFKWNSHGEIIILSSGPLKGKS